MSKLVKMWAEICKPDNEYSMLSYFIISKESGYEDIKEQIVNYSEKGIHRVILQSDNTKLSCKEELTEVYFDKVRQFLTCAQEVNTKVYLQHIIMDDEKKNMLKGAYSIEKLREIYEKYYMEVKEYFGNTIIGIIVPDNVNDAEPDVTNEIINWCDKHYIELVGTEQGNINIEQSMKYHLPGYKLSVSAKKDISGSQNNILDIEYRKNQTGIKLISDISRYFKKRRNCNQLYGVVDKMDVNLEVVKSYIDALVIQNVNMFSPNIFYKKDTEMGDKLSYIWNDTTISKSDIIRFTMYASRWSYIMTDSVNNATIAVLCNNAVIPDKEIQCLYDNQIEFNYLPIELLPRSIVNGRKKLQIGDYEYDAVIDYTDCNSRYLTNCKVIKDNNELSEYIKKAKTGLKTPVKNIKYTGIVKNGRKMHIIVNESNKDEKVQLNIENSMAGIVLDLWNETAQATILDEGITVRPSSCIVVIEFIANDKEKINLAIKEMNKKSQSITINEL